MRRKLFLVTLSFLFAVMIVVSLFSQVEAITWSVKRTQVTSYAFTDEYPAIMQTKDRRIWVIWSREIDANMTLFYKTSNDLGKTWSVEQNLTQEPTLGRDEYPAAMQVENGTIWVTWASTVQPPTPPVPDFYLTAVPLNLTVQQGGSVNSTIVVASINGFSEEVKFMTGIDLPVGVTVGFNPSRVTPPANGQVNSTMTIHANSTAVLGNYTFTVIAKGTTQTHSINVNLEVTALGTLQLHVQQAQFASSGGSVLQATDDYEIYYKTSHDNGATWSANMFLTDNPINDLHPAITQLQNGTIMIFWQTNVSGNYDIWFKTTTDGISWSSAKQLTSNLSNDMTPAVTQAKDGATWLVWCSDRNGNSDIFYKIYNGVSWSADTLLTPASSANADVQPAIVQAMDGNVMIFWTWDNNLDLDVYYANSTSNGLSWSAKTLFAGTNFEDEYPALVRTQDTRIWVAWMSNEAGDFEIYLRGSLAGDINGDGRIDILDLTIISIAYGTQPGDQYWNPNADLNKDGIVEISDLWIVAYYLDET